MKPARRGRRSGFRFADEFVRRGREAAVASLLGVAAAPRAAVASRTGGGACRHANTAAPVMFVRHSGAVGKLRRRGIRPAPAERVSFLVGDAETLPLLAASCEPLATEPHDAELRAMGDRVEARLRVARMLAPLRERAREAAALARMAIEAIAGGSFGDALITACV